MDVDDKTDTKRSTSGPLDVSENEPNDERNEYPELDVNGEREKDEVVEARGADDGHELADESYVT